MNLEFSGSLWRWQGPAAWHFVTVPVEQSGDLKACSKLTAAGWGMIPVHVQVGQTTWKTSLFPHEDSFVVPIKASVRKAEQLQEGVVVTIRLTVQ